MDSFCRFVTFWAVREMVSAFRLQEVALTLGKQLAMVNPYQVVEVLSIPHERMAVFSHRETASLLMLQNVMSSRTKQQLF